MQTTEIKSILSRTGGQRLLAGVQRIGNCYSGTDMVARNRSITVLFSLIASMTVGAIVLMVLDDQHPLTPTFSLTAHLRLGSAEKAINNTLVRPVAHWDQVQVYYSNTTGGDAAELALLTGLANGTKDQFHFLVGNGSGAQDGEIQAGEFWIRQRLCQGRSGLVRVCIISDGRTGSITDSQRKQTEALLEELIRSFDISRRNIHYPANW